MKTGKKKTGIRSKIGSLVIMCLIAVFALLIAFTFIRREQSAAAGAAGVTGQPGPGAQGQQNGSGNGRAATVVRVTPVAPGTIENSLVINGDVLARNQVSIFPPVADRVRRGDVVAMVDPSRPGEVYSWSPVVSTIAGTVLQAPFSIGDTLSTQSAVLVVGDLSELRVETFVPERFVSAVRQGLGAQVSFEGIPGETFYAEVDEVSPVLYPASRTMRIRLRFAGRTAGVDPRIKAGMFATITLVTNTRADVPVIPRTAVINTYGLWIVFTVDENSAARRREVEVGIENEELFEIVSGVAIGDRVVSAGQHFLSDGDPVRIVE